MSFLRKLLGKKPTDDELFAAARAGEAKRIRRLIAYGADIGAIERGYTDGTPLHAAAAWGHGSAVEVILQAGADKNARGKRGHTALHSAAQAGHELVVKALVDAGADMDVGDSDGRTALHYAARYGRELAVKALIDAGADINASANSGQTALHYAASAGHELVVEALVDAGADVEARSGDGETALHKAAECDCGRGAPVVDILAGAGANLEAKDNRGHTPLCAAVYRECNHSDPSVVKALLRAGVDTGAGAMAGDGPLYWAILGGHVPLAKALIQGGADLEARSDGCQSPLCLAISEGDASLVTALIEAGVDLGARDGGITPLQYAAMGDSAWILAILLEAGAQIDQSAMSLAERKGNASSIRMLREAWARTAETSPGVGHDSPTNASEPAPVIVMESGKSFCCLNPQNPYLSLEEFRPLYDACVSWFQAGHGNTVDPLCIEFADIGDSESDHLATIAISGLWDDSKGLRLPDETSAAAKYEVYSDHRSLPLRRTEYLQKRRCVLASAEV